MAETPSSRESRKNFKASPCNWSSREHLWDTDHWV